VKIGPYEVLGELGRGATGVVYKVRTPDGREAALKLLTKMDQAAFARFERERRLLAALGEEQGFVGLLDAGTSAEGAWLVMPFVPGGTLRQRLERGPLGVAETVAVGAELARALGAAHARGIVHRDVKPENVLFTSSGRPLLADLGLAKHFDFLASGASRSVQLTVRGAFKGTAGYMAPEQIGDAGTVGPPADVFALGAVLHECLSGKPAFSGATVLDVLAKVGSGTVEPLRDVPPWLEEIVTGALALDPRARFADGSALAEALRSGAGASPGKVVRPGGRGGALVPIVAGATLGALVLAVLAVTLGRTAPHDVAKPVADKASRSTRELDELAVEKLGREELDRALSSTTRAIELHPTVPMAWLNRGCVRARLGDQDGAIADATKAIELDPDLPVAWARRGAARVNKGDWDGAIADENKAIALGSNLPEAFANRGVARANKGDWDGEFADESKAIELDAGYALAWDNRGVARSHRGDWDGEIADETRAIELDPDRAMAWMNRGIARGKKGDLDGAIADENRAIELNPYLSMAWLNRATARAKKGDLEGEIADETRAIALAPDNPISWADRGIAWLSRGDWDKAIADETRAIELVPNLAVAWANRGAAKGNKGDLQGAIDDLERALALGVEEPDATQVRANLETVRKHVR
jgi:tetratricopeptide (TPR) repeat protein/tRNA A-37 threonylcarbamoyl transferase component Bud32